jgi:hypothetical protein
MKTFFYFPVSGVKNKAQNANLTIDWFKKNFRYPIKSEYFVQLNYSEEGDVSSVPLQGQIISFVNDLETEMLCWQGSVEVVLREKRVCGEEMIHILLKEL